MSRLLKGLGKIKKSSVFVKDPELSKAFDKVYEDINKLTDSLNLPSGTSSKKGYLGNDGDIRLYKGTGYDGSEGYFLQGRFKDGWATVQLSLEEKNPETTDISIAEDAGGGVEPYITKYGVKYSNMVLNDAVGLTASQVAPGDHNHNHSTLLDITNTHYTHNQINAHIDQGSGLNGSDDIHREGADSPDDDSDFLSISLDANDAGDTIKWSRSNHHHKLDTSINPIGDNKMTGAWHIKPDSDEGVDYALTVDSSEVAGYEGLKVVGDFVVDGDATIGLTSDGNGNTDILGYCAVTGAITGQSYLLVSDYLQAGALTSNLEKLKVYGKGFLDSNATDYSLNLKNASGPQLRLEYSNSKWAKQTVDTGGNLLLDSYGNTVIHPRPDGHDTNAGGKLLPYDNRKVDLGDYNRMWRSLFVSEIYAETLVAQDVLATVGGRIMVAPTAKLTNNITSASNTITVTHNIFEQDDFAMLKSAPVGLPQMEIVKITSNAVPNDTFTETNLADAFDETPNAFADHSELSNLNLKTRIKFSNPHGLDDGDWIVISGTGGDNSNGGYDGVWKVVYKTLAGNGSAYINAPSTSEIDIIAKFQSGNNNNAYTIKSSPWVYNISRDQDGTGANNWYKDDAIVNLDHETGRGFIELTATETSLQQLGPSMTIFSRTGSSNWDDIEPVVNVGNMRSYVDYSSDDMGIGIGTNLTSSPSAVSNPFKGLVAENTNGLRLFNSDIESYKDGVKKLEISSSGNVKIGEDLSNQTPLFHFNNTDNKLYLTGDVLIGNQTLDNTVFSNRGPWAAGINYNINDLVTHDGQGWISTVEHTSTVSGNDYGPPNSNPWTLLVPGGSDGAEGSSGIGASGWWYYNTISDTIPTGDEGAIHIDSTSDSILNTSKININIKTSAIDSNNTQISAEPIVTNLSSGDYIKLTVKSGIFNGAWYKFKLGATQEANSYTYHISCTFHSRSTNAPDSISVLRTSYQDNFAPSVLIVANQGSQYGFLGEGSVSLPPLFNGLFIDDNNMGYANDGIFSTYMDNSGNFYLGGTSGALTYDSSTNTLDLSSNSSNTTISGDSITTGTITGRNIKSADEFSEDIPITELNMESGSSFLRQYSDDNNWYSLISGGFLEFNHIGTGTQLKYEYPRAFQLIKPEHFICGEENTFFQHGLTDMYTSNYTVIPIPKSVIATGQVTEDYITANGIAREIVEYPVSDVSPEGFTMKCKLIRGDIIPLGGALDNLTTSDLVDSIYDNEGQNGDPIEYEPEYQNIGLGGAHYWGNDPNAHMYTANAYQYSWNYGITTNQYTFARGIANSNITGFASQFKIKIRVWYKSYGFASGSIGNSSYNAGPWRGATVLYLALRFGDRDPTSPGGTHHFLSEETTGIVAAVDNAGVETMENSSLRIPLVNSNFDYGTGDSYQIGETARLDKGGSSANVQIWAIDKYQDLEFAYDFISGEDGSSFPTDPLVQVHCYSAHKVQSGGVYGSTTGDIDDAVWLYSYYSPDALVNDKSIEIIDIQHAQVPFEVDSVTGTNVVGALIVDGLNTSTS